MKLPFEINDELAKLESHFLSEKNRLYEEKWNLLASWDFKKEDYDALYVDEVLEIRILVRENKNYKLSDEIRSYLDEKFVFVFDAKKDGKPFQEVRYLFSSYFSGIDNTKFKTNREYVESKIKESVASNSLLDAWIYSNQNSK